MRCADGKALHTFEQVVVGHARRISYVCGH